MCLIRTYKERTAAQNKSRWRLRLRAVSGEGPASRRRNIIDTETDRKAFTIKRKEQ